MKMELLVRFHFLLNPAVTPYILLSLSEAVIHDHT